MCIQFRSHIFKGLLAAASILIFSSPASAQLHSVMLSVPDRPEEALDWCGPATGKMIMEGHPSGSCAILEEDIWMAIQSHKVETLWDTDPAGLRGAMMALCPPAWNWSIYSKTDASSLIHSVARWMTINSYPVAGLLNTVSHNGYTAHEEHWVAIRGIVTDVDPTTNPSVNLEFVWFNDPAVPLGDPSIERFVSGSTWYSEFQPVNKAGSSYVGKYVAIIEPPEITGVALAQPEILVGRVILPAQALKYADQWIEKYKLYDMKPYGILKGAQALKPLLVNRNHGGYYIIPYARKGQLAEAAVIVNAYNGGFQEVGAFKPVEYMPEKEAVEIALKHVLGGINPQAEPPGVPRAELIYPQGERVVSRYFPIWKVTVNQTVIGINREGKIYTRMPSQEISIANPAKNPGGLAWDGSRLWSIDGKTKKLQQIDPLSGAVSRSLEVNVNRPKGMAFDGKSLWVADEETMKLLSVNPENGQVEKTIKMEVPPEKGFRSVEGLTWDGEHLWIAYFAGFSSSFNQLDPRDGRIVKSIFADCQPRGIASDGVYLWSVCYNGENLPAKIDRRKIAGKEHEMLRSREFVSDIEGRDPTGLVFDGQYLWYTDRRLQRTRKLFPGRLNEK